MAFGVRIPLKPATHSTRKRPPSPREAGHLFHGKPATHRSEATRVGALLSDGGPWRQIVIGPEQVVGVGGG